MPHSDDMGSVTRLCICVRGEGSEIHTQLCQANYIKLIRERFLFLNVQSLFCISRRQGVNSS